MTQTITPTHTPPNIVAMPFIGNAGSFIFANGMPVDFLLKAQQEHGGLVHFKVMNQSFYLVSDPDLIREVLLERVRDFHKPDALTDQPLGLRRFLGNSILTADYDEWKPQRKLIQPLMHAKHIEKYADIMAQNGEALLNVWKDGTVRDIHADMIQVTMWVITEAMFGTTVDQNSDLENAALSAQKIVVDDLISLLPAWLTGRNAEAEKVNNLLTELVTSFVAEHLQNADKERHDLLSLLLETRDENGHLMSDEFIRNNILTMFFAGHETTANTLTWVFYQLAQNPDVLHKLQTEVDSVLGGRLPTLADLPNLPYTLMVIKETMRIQPTVSVYPRAVLEDTTLGDYQIKANSIVLISPYVLHHDPQKWENPTQFDPERFSADNEPLIPKYAYMPFGSGPRICIGNHFSYMESQILLALIINRYQLHLVPGTKIKPVHQVTSFPKDGLPMQIEQRV